MCGPVRGERRRRTSRVRREHDHYCARALVGAVDKTVSIHACVSQFELAKNADDAWTSFHRSGPDGTYANTGHQLWSLQWINAHDKPLGLSAHKKWLKWQLKRAEPLKSSGPIVARKTYFGVRIFTHRAGPKNGEIRKPELKTSAANLAESRNEQR